MKLRWFATLGVVLGLNLLFTACGGSGASATPAPSPTKYVLTVNSSTPVSGVAITVSPADSNGASNGSTSFTRSYTAGSAVTLTAPATVGSNTFTSWSGCTSASTVTCSVTMNASITVTANYAAPVSAKTYYVSGSGNDTADGLTAATAFRTLQHAADLTAPGDTVLAMNGTYSNTTLGGSVLVVNNSGTAANWITYKAYPGATPTISYTGWAGISFGPTTTYIEINGFTVLGDAYSLTLAGALAQSYTSPDPAYNGNCISIDGRNGTSTLRASHIRILNNTVGACPGAGIGTAQSDYVTISGNTIYDTAWYSIYDTSAISTWESWNSDANTGYKMIITGNRIYGSKNLVPSAAGQPVTDGEGIIVDTNRNDYTGSTMAAYAGRTLIANNVVFNNGSSAIEVFDSDHADVVNNSTYGDVTIHDVSGRGEMNINKASDVNVFNNIFYSTTGQNPATTFAPCTACVFNYNVYFNGTNSPTTINGANDITADPQYVNSSAATPATMDLHVAPASPAVNSGTSKLAPATDFSGTARPQGSGYDRGAYEQ